MKFRVKDTNETLPVVQDSLICGLRPDGNEVEFSVNDVELIPDDWSAFRREAAKDILANVAGQLVHEPTTITIDEFDPEFYARVAVEWADALIAKLKENEKSQ